MSTWTTPLWVWPLDTNVAVLLVALMGIMFGGGWFARVELERHRARRMQAQFIAGLEAKFRATMAGKRPRAVILPPGFGSALGYSYRAPSGDDDDQGPA